MRTYRTLVITALFAIALPLSVSAQRLPRTVQMYAPGTPGGTLDLVARAAAAALEQSFGRDTKVIVRNVRRHWLSSGLKKRDGSQLAIVLSGHAPYNLTAMNPLGMIARHDLALYVSSSSRIKSLADLGNSVSQFSRRPVVVGTSLFLGDVAALDTFRTLNVPVRVTADLSYAAQASLLAGGKLDAIIASVRATQQSDHLKAIAVFSTDSYPSIRTATQQGVPVTASIDYGVVTVPELADGVYAFLDQALKAATTRSGFKKRLKDLGLRPDYRSGEAFRPRLEFAVNTYCSTCDCGKQRCKKNCSKCN